MTYYPLVSCVLTTYNRSKILKRAITSVLNQTYTNIELIIIDDNSKDNTSDVVKIINNKRIKYIRNTSNKGLSYNRNLGASLSKGEFVAFIDDDDEWFPLKIEKQLLIFERDKSDKLGLVYTWSIMTNSKKNIGILAPNLTGEIFKHSIDDQPITNGSTWLIKKEVFKKIKFDTAIKRGIDGDFVRQISLLYHVDVLMETMVHYHVGHGFQRITSNEKDSIVSAIKAHKITLNKFSNQILQHPLQTSSLLSFLALDYIRIQEYKNAYKYFMEAFKTSLLSKKLYKNLLKAFLIFLGVKS